MTTRAPRRARILLAAVALVAPLVTAVVTTPAAAAHSPTAASMTHDQGSPGPQPLRAPREWFSVSGSMFDTCDAPSLKTMKAWRDSPYVAVGVYIGGISRSCDQQRNLTRDWVSAVHADGWHLVPIYVGRQAECGGRSVHGKFVKFKHRISHNLTTAAAQGTAAAKDAVAQMQTLGLGPHNPIYLDMEAWNTNKTDCTASTMAFTDAWTQQLHRQQYLSGFYSSAGSGIDALVKQVQSDSSFHRPDAVWFARWDGVPTTDDPKIPASLWGNHQRIKQHDGGHLETHGGVTVNIDSGLVDAPVTNPTLLAGPARLPTVTPGMGYRAQLTATNPSGRSGKPYRFHAVEGTLPDGLRLSSSGRISGKTWDAGRSSVVVEVSAANGAQRARHVYQLLVAFDDVAPSALFYGPVSWLTRTRITSGYDDGTFRPKAGVTRGAMAAFLYRYTHDGAGPPACTTAPFPDVQPGDLFCGHITWLAKTGITAGYPDGEFKADNTVTRGAMAAFLYRYTHDGAGPPACTTAPFPDVQPGDLFCGHITWLATTGITQGYPDGTFRADNTVTRGAMAAFLQRLSR